MKLPRAGVALLVAVGWLIATAHVVVTVDTGQALVEARWDASQLIRVALWDELTDARPQVAAGTDVVRTVRAALEAWIAPSELTVVLETTPERTLAAAADLHLVTLPEAGSPDAALLESGVLATTVLEIDPSGKIIDGDVLLSPAPELGSGQPGVWTTDESTAAGLNLLTTVRHEFGHLFNLTHSPHLDATMYLRSGHFPYHVNTLSWDDVAGLNRSSGGGAYRMLGLDQITGAVDGHVGSGGEDVFGAVVVACDADGLSVASGISLPDGSYSIQNLPPGNYTLYVQPLSGPTTPADVTGGIFDGLAAPDFVPEFYLGSSDPNVAVTAGTTTTGVDFEVGGGGPQLAPSQVGAETDINDGFTTGSFPGLANPDTETNVIVAGAGFGGVNALGLLGPHLTQTAFIGNLPLADFTPAALFKVAINEAPRGPYPLLPRSAAEQGAITGGLEIVHPLRFESAFAQFIDFPALGGARLLLLNPALDGGDVAGSVDVRDPDGLAAAVDLGGGNAFSLPPGASTTLASTGSEDFVGSARARADGPLGGAVLFDTSVGVTGVGVSRPAYRFLAPVVIDDSGDVDTGLALTNLDDRRADYFVRVQDKTGRLTTTFAGQLAGSGQIARFVRELVAGLSSPFQGTLLITSNRPLGATVIRTAPGLFTTFPVVESHSGASLDFSHFVHLPGAFSSEVILLNPSSALTATGVVVEFHDPDGNPRPLTFGGVTAADGRFEVDDIPPLGCVILTGGGSEELVGALHVTGSLPLGGVVLFTSDDFGTTGVGASPVEPSFASVISQDAALSIGTGFAVSNPGSTPLDLEVSARHPSGAAAGGPIAVTVAPHGHLSRFASEDLNDDGGNLGLPDAFDGSLWIRSVDGRPFAATILRQRLQPGNLTTFPAIVTRPLVKPQR